MSLAALASVRASPPPFVLEVGAFLIDYLHSAQDLADAFVAASHPSSRQLIDAVVSSLDAQGTHASLSIALTPA
eukprot:6753971-Prymnesium_polylepis.1